MPRNHPKRTDDSDPALRDLLRFPADHKWYRNRAIGRLLLEHLEQFDPRYPKADCDVAECRERLLRAP
ncbi:hypothetical protein [Streptomyces sp. NPDC058683]|uniref:hypothetical protein n=1 Tax=Streptomyces sp. NPDC058683 TaxID=3346597 RepID=UPI003667850E